MSRLWKSAKFWVAIWDATFATLAIVLAFFLAPDRVREVLAMITIWQPVFMLVISGITQEDVASKQAGNGNMQAKL